MTVTVYTRTTCSPCKTVKWFLDKHGVEYVEKNIDDPAIMDEFSKLTSVQMVPLVVAGDSKIQGLNLQSLKKVIDFLQNRK